MIVRLDTRDRHGRGPDAPLPVAITPLLRGDRTGIELRLADAPGRALVRVLGERTQLGPCSGLIDDSHIVVPTQQVPALAEVAATWRQRRVEFPGYELGFRAPGYGSRSARRYRVGTWAPQTLPTGSWRDGELEFRARPMSPGVERFGPLSAEVELQNGLGDRVGVVLKWLRASCIWLVRGCLVVSTPWPREPRDVEAIARLLLTSSRHDRDAYSLGFLEAAAEFDVYSATLLEACNGAFLSKQTDDWR